MTLNPMVDSILDYVRMVSYASIVLSSLYKIFEKKFSELLFLGDICIAVALLLCGLHTYVFEMRPPLISDLVLTPASVFWAIIHLYSMIKQINGKT